MTDEKKTLKPFVEILEVGNPIGHQNLTLVPLRGEENEPLDYILAAEAIEEHKLVITEINEGGSVPELQVTSTTDKMILLLDGEELVGAKQNRILNTTILLPAKVHDMKIPVSCVEQGRWSYRSREFSSGHYAPAMLRASKSKAVHFSLREVGRPESDQGEVWDEVACLMEEAKVSSSTNAMKDVVDQRRESLEHYVEALPYPEGARGVVVAINGKFVALDMFDKSATLRSIWNRLVTGYAVDAIIRQDEKNDSFSAKGTQVMLERVGQIECESFPSVGIGDDWRFEAEDILGQALIAEGVCVHLCAFPNNDRNRRQVRDSRIMSPSYRRRRHN